MKNNETRVCPICGKAYHEYPALSRADGKTEICPDCGTRQALEAVGISAEKREEILEIIRQSLDGNEPQNKP